MAKMKKLRTYKCISIRNDVGGSEYFQLPNDVQVEIIKSFYDYETGRRYIAKVHDENIINELRKIGTSGYTAEDYRKYGEDHYQDVLKAMKEFDPSIIYF